MPSHRARLVSRYLRWTFKPIDISQMDPAELRALVEKRTPPLWPKGVEREEITSPVKGEWQRPNNSTPGATIYYLHGGGYVFGSPRTHRSLTYALSRAAAAPVFSLDYRLAPEHPCPAAIEDALAGWDWLLSTGLKPGEIVVGGDSAGGGLTLALLQALRKRGGPLPAGAFLYSPWTDLAATGEAIRENAESDPMFQADKLYNGGRHYAGALERTDPRVSPLYGSFVDLPKTLIFASGTEILRDDSVRAVEKMKAAGVDVEFILHDGLPHAWPIFRPLMPESQRTIEKTAAFIRRVVKSDPARAQLETAAA